MVSQVILLILNEQSDLRYTLGYRAKPLRCIDVYLIRLASMGILDPRQTTSNISRTKSQNLNVNRFTLQLSLPNTL